IVPGLAFDRGGGRLGYGGGYYDRFLRRLPVTATLVGIAFADQLVGAVPLAGGDVKVDLVVTDAGVIRCDGADERLPDRLPDHLPDP
ncbi:MAG TPA: 5-formyltetrahydrofolate cyclo-ligase, partial [Acidimicrobiales bacterium]|nr:5-formyltetrahydrofolate cyclo-ligase [Acidimicrobiales bacterium]